MNIGYRRNSWYWWGANTSFLWRYLLVVSIQIVCASTSYSVVYIYYTHFLNLACLRTMKNSKVADMKGNVLLYYNQMHFIFVIPSSIFLQLPWKQPYHSVWKSLIKISCDNNCDRSSASKLSIQRKEIKVWTYATFSVKDFKWISNIV